MQIGPYVIREEIARDGQFVLCRGEREDGRRVLLKAAASPGALSAAIASLERERELLAELDMDGVPRVRDYEAQPGALVFEDDGGVPLRALLADGPLALGDFFPIAIRLAATLGALHRRGAVLRDPSPYGLLRETRENS